MRKIIFSIVILVIASIVLPGATISLYAQTPGLIYKPATNGGNKVLDPNGDGYVSLTNVGFSGQNMDEGSSYSEIPYKPFPVFMDEPLSDLGTGAKFGHTDFAPKGTGSSPLSAHFDGTNFLFRVRLAGQSTASKGYSILIDTNNNVSGTGLNPGFEYEIVLATNFDVRIYNHGTNANTAGPIIFNGSVDQYSQKALAASLGGGDADYFYDFYVPLSAFQGGITSSTGLRMTGVTVTSAKSGLFGVASDIGGVDDTKYSGNLTGALKDIIGSYTPTTPTGIQINPFPLVQATPPIVNSPIYTNSATITGTSTESAGSIITVYKNGAAIGNTTVNTNGVWSFSTSGVTLVAGDKITATVTPSGKSISATSNSVTVLQALGNTTGCSTQPPVVTALTNSDKDFTVIVTSPGTIKIYYIDGTGATIYYGYYVASNTGTHTITLSNSTINYTTPTNGKFPDGKYFFTLTAQNGGCTSENSNSLCSSSSLTVAAPTISPTSITTQTATITVTGPSGSTLVLYKNGVQIGTSTTNPWNVSLSGLVNGDVFYARATLQETKSSCTSTASSELSNSVVATLTTTSPTISGSYCQTATTIKGTSTETAGTTIKIFRINADNSTTQIGSSTVNAFGNWTATGVTLSGGWTIRATATAPGKAESPLSSAVTITTAYAPSILSINTSPAVVEGNTSVSGKAPAGSSVTLYINDEPYRDNSGNLAPVTAASGDTWTINNISPFELYAGAKLTIRATASSGSTCESAPSASVEVQCKPADQTITTTLSKVKYCPGEKAVIKLSKSETGTIYNIYIRTTSQTDAQATLFSHSVLGTGSAINLTSFDLTNADDGKIIFVRTVKVGAPCQYKIGGDLSVSVYSPVPNTFIINATNQNACPGASSIVTVKNAFVGYSYQLIDNTTKAKIGSAIVPTVDGDINFPAMTISLTTTYGVIITRLDGGCIAENVNANTITITRTGPTVNQTVTPSSSTVCVNSSVTFSFSTQNGYTYNLKDKNNSTVTLASVLGDGSAKSLSTGSIATAGTKTYQIEVVVPSGCTSNFIAEPTVNVTNTPAVTVSAGPNQTICGTTATLQGSNPAPGSGVWTKTSGPAGGTITTPTSANTTVTGLLSGTYVFTWTVTTSCGTTVTTPSTITITVNCPPTLVVKTTKFIDEYSVGDDLVVISDPDGGIASYLLTSGILPPGTALSIVGNNTVLKVQNTMALVAGSYTFMVRTTDTNGVSSNTSILVRMYDRISTPTPPTPLPIQLAYFTGSAANGQVQLRWVTVSEIDNDRFEVERSSNGESFTLIGTVKGSGNSSQKITYGFTDAHPGAGTVYYRLRQVDFSGEHSYSKVISVALGQLPQAGLAQAYPNPFDRELNAMVTLPAAGEVRLQVIDSRGKAVYSDRQHMLQGINEVTLPLGSLSTGLYFLKLSGQDISTTLKVLKAQ